MVREFIALTDLRYSLSLPGCRIRLNRIWHVHVFKAHRRVMLLDINKINYPELHTQPIHMKMIKMDYLPAAFPAFLSLQEDYSH